MPATAALATLILVAACSGVSEPADRPGARELLRDHLSVAAAALAAGQPAVARRLYLSLAERFDDSPEPVLGLGYISLHNLDLEEARRQFLQAADLAQASPATRGEALLGAGRTALALGDTQAARQHLLDARALVQDPSSVMWIENGLAVAAVLEADYETAETHYTEALRQASAHPRIAANFVRMLIASGRIDAAAGIYERYGASYWEEEDSHALQNLLDTARQQSMPPRRVDTRLLLEWPSPDPPPSNASQGLGPSTGVALVGASGLTLRLTGEAGWAAPPAADAGFAVPDYAGVHRPRPTSGGGEATALKPPSTKASFALRLGVPILYPARSAITPTPGATVPGFAAPPDASPTPVLLSAAVATTPSTVAASAPTTERDAIPVPMPSSVGAAPVLMNVVPELDSAWFEKETQGSADFNGDTWSDASFLHPILPPDPIGLTRGATPAPSQPMIEGHALSRPMPSSSSPSSAPFNGLWEPEAAFSQRLILSAADVGHSSMSRASFLQSVFLLDLTMLQSGTTATASDSAREPALASFVDAFYSGAAPSSRSHVWDQGAAWPGNTTLTAGDLGLDSWFERVFLQRAFSLDRAIPSSNTTTFAADPTSELDAALLTAAFLSRDEPTLLNDEGERQAARYESAAPVDPASDRVRNFDKSSASFASAPASEGLNVRPIEHAWTGDAAPDSATPSQSFASAEELPNMESQPPELHPGDAPPHDEWIVLLGKSRRWHLDSPAKAVAAASPEIADVQLLSPTVLYVIGKNAGNTSISVLGEDGSVLKRNVLVVIEIGPLRALLGADPDLQGVQVQRLARGVALSGEVGSPAAAERAVGLAAASIPEGMLVENNLEVGLDLAPLRSLMAGEPGLDGVQVQRVARGVALSGEVASVATADRAFRLAAASLPEGLLVENNLRVALDVGPLRALLGADPDLKDVRVQRLARGVALSGEVGSPAAAERAVGLAAASIPEGMLVENNLEVGLDLAPVRSLMAGEPGLDGVQVQRVARGVALSGEVASVATADRAFRLAAASLPEGLLVENNLRVALDVGPLRALLGADPDLQGVQVQRLARGVALSGEVGSPAAAERAVGLAAASIPEGMLVENNLEVGLDLAPLRSLMAGEPGLDGVQVQRVARGVALSGEVASVATADRAFRLAAASLPEGLLVENNLRVALDVGPLRALLGADPDLKDVRVQRLARGVALSGEVGSPAAAERAVGLAAASIPEGMLVENNLEVGLDLAPVRSLMAGEPGLDGVQVQRVARGVALSGEVASVATADRAFRLAAASLPEGLLVENNLRVALDVGPLRALLGADPDLQGVQVQRLARGVALTGAVGSAGAAERAVGLAAASIPEGMLVENNLEVGLDLAPLRSLMAGEPGLDGVQVQRVARGVALSGEVASVATADRAFRLAAASLPEGLLVENNLRVALDVGPLRALLGADPDLKDVRVQRLARGVALSGEVGSPAAAERAVGLAAASIPEGMLVENNLEVGLDLAPVRSLMAGEPGLDGVQVQRVARGVALSGEVASVATADRAFRLAAASLPEGLLVENNLRVALDVGPLRALLGADPDLQGVQVQRLARGVALTGAVGSAGAAERAVGLAAASIPEGMLVENNLEVGLDLAPLRSLMAGEPGLDGVQVQRVARGVALSGEVASVATADRAFRLAAASLPEGLLVENNLRVALDVGPLRALLGADPDLKDVRVQRLARGVALSGEVGSPAAAERAVGLAAASIPEGMLVENNLEVGLDLAPVRSLMAGEPGLDGVQVQRVARGVALSGEVASVATADRAFRLAAASLPEGLLVENNLRVALDVGPLRALLGADPDLQGVQVQRLARGVALTGAVGSAGAAERAVGLAAASIPEGMLVENNLEVGLDLAPLRSLMAGEPGLDGVQVQRVARGVALSGEVASVATADRAFRLAAASLPEGLLVENNLRVALDVGPLRALLGADPDLKDVRVQRLARGVALSGEVGSPAAAERAVGLAAASIPEGMLVENNLEVGLDLAPLRSLMAGEPGLDGVQVQRVARGVALSGEVASVATADRAFRLAAASLPEGLLVENNLRVALDVGPLRALLGADPDLQGVQVQRLARGVALTGAVGSAGAAERAVGLATASIPEGMLVENNLEVGLDLAPLRSLMAGEPGLDGVQVQRVARGVALSGEVASVATADRAFRLAAASLPEGLLVENNLRVALDVGPLRALLGADPDLQGVQVQRLARGVALTGAVGSAGAAERAVGLAAASIPEGMLVENNLEVGLDLAPLRSLMAGEPGLDGVQVQRVARGVALSGEVASVATADRAFRLAAASLPEGLLVENNLRVALDVGPLRALLGADPDLQGVQVQRLARGVALTGAVGSAGAAERAVGLAAASIPEGMLVENNLEVGLDLAPLRSLMAGEPGLDGVQVQRVARGVALSGEVASVATADRAFRLAAASLPEGLLVENNLRVALDVGPLRALLGADPDLQGVRVQRLARGVALTGAVGSAGAAERAVGLAAASIPEGMLVENNLEVGLDLAPLRSLMAGEPGLDGVQVQRVARGVALSGEVASVATADRAFRLAAASLPEGLLVENNLRVALDVGPLRALLGADPDLQGVQVQRLARGVALTGAVGSAGAAERAVGLAAASIPEGMLVENNLEVGLDLAPLRSLMAGEPGLDGVQVQRVARGVALSGEVASVATADRAFRLAAASLPEGLLVENNLRVALDVGPLRALLGADPDLQDVQVQRLARGVALSGEVGSPAAAERAVGLAAASIPEGMLVENNLEVGLDLAPLRSLMAGEPGLDGVQVQRVARGVALSGEVASVATADRAFRLAAASLPEGLLVENNLRVALDVGPLRALLGADPDLQDVQVQRLARGVALSGEVGSPAAAERAVGLAAASIPEGMLVENNLEVGLDLAPLRSLMAGEPGLDGVQVQRVARGVALSGEVSSEDEADRAFRLAAASLPEGMSVENNLRVALDVGPLRALLARDPDLQGVQVQRLARGVALTGAVGSAGAAERAVGLAAASIPEDLLVENNLRVALDVGPLRALLGTDPELRGVQVQPLARGVALTGEVGSPAAAERADRLALASIPEGMLVENSLRVALDVGPLRALLAVDPDLKDVRAQAVSRGVALSGEVGSPAAAERAVGLAAASIPEGMLVENNLEVGLDLAPLRSLMAGEPGLDGVQVQRVARGVALSGEVSSEDEADRAFRLAAASLPEGMSVENNLRVALDVGPLRALLARDPDLQGVQVQRLARGVALTGAVGSAGAAERAVGLAAASIPEDLLVENNLRVALDVGPLRALLGTDPELRGVQVQPLARGVALTGEVGSPAAAERADRLALASIPEGMLVENSLRVALDVGPLRALLAVDPDLKDVRAQAVSRGVALSGEVGSAAAAERAVGLAAASIPEDMLIHNNLEVGLDLALLRSLMAGEPGLDGVQVQRVARGVALSGEVSSEDEADRALRLAAASLPEGLPVENNLRLTPNVDSLGALLASDPDFGNVLIQRLERGVILSGEVDSPAVAQRAVQLAVASLPQDMLVQSNLVVGLDLAPLRALIVGEPELRRIQVRRVARGITLSGEVGSAAAADRALRLAAASLPDDILVESSLRIVPDVEALRVLFATDPILQGVRVKRLARGVALSGEVASQGAAERAVRLSIASLPQDMLVENNLEVGLDLGPLRSLMAGEPGLGGVQVHRVARGVALSGEVNSEAAVERAVRLASASLPQDLLVESNLRIETDLQPLRTLLASEPDLHRVRVQRVARGVALSGEVGSAAASERALRFATASLPKDALVDNHMSITGPQQVNLEVQIAEVQRSIAEDFGFNWEIFGHSNDPLGFGFRIGRGLPDGTSLVSCFINY